MKPVPPKMRIRLGDLALEPLSLRVSVLALGAGVSASPGIGVTASPKPAPIVVVKKSLRFGMPFPTSLEAFQHVRTAQGKLRSLPAWEVPR